MTSEATATRIYYKGFAEASQPLHNADTQRRRVKAMSDSEVSQQPQEPEFAVFVGIDWADQKHVWCLQVAGSAQRESGELEHTVETVEAWVAQLCQRFGNRPIAIAVNK